MSRPRLVRPSSNKMIAGVCAGLADYFGVETRKVGSGSCYSACSVLERSSISRYG